MVEFINVEKYNLKDINIKINKEDFFVICGEGGSGKTTILKLINGEILPDKGSVNIAKNIKNKIAFIRQEENIFEDKTVIENISTPLRLEKRYNKEKVFSILKKFNMEKYADIKAKNLSYSYKQLLKIATCTAMNSLLLLADEPINNLDETQQKLVMAVLKEKHILGTTIILTTKTTIPYYTKILNL